MAKKKIKLRYKQERVVLSDVNPFELPLIYSNRNFYRVLVKSGVEINDSGQLIVNGNIPPEMKACLEFLFDKDSFNRATSPFVYQIENKGVKKRNLAIIHPKDQLKVVDFYKKYAQLIIYYCNRSSFSIRKPVKVASFIYYRDKLHFGLLGEKKDTAEMVLKEYESLKSYFSYESVDNIYKFYDRNIYHRAEKRFEYLQTLDVQSCFDSIYTHTISWVTKGGVIQAKNNIKSGGKDFGDMFDTLMQDMNYKETNGILIGAEFSRLFAEIILQDVDKKLENELMEKKIYLHRDYEIYRYVDDYFVFYNDDFVRDAIMNQLSMNLKLYKLTLGTNKNESFSRPFITPITVAKEKISDLIKDQINYDYKNKDIIIDSELDNDVIEESLGSLDQHKLDEYLNEKQNLFLSSNTIIKKYKMIVYESQVELQAITNYALQNMYQRLVKLLKQSDKRLKYYLYYINYTKGTKLEVCVDKLNKLRTAISHMIVGYLEVLFFIYSGNRKVNTTLKLMNAINRIVTFYKSDCLVNKKKINRFDIPNREIVFKKILDEVSLVLNLTPIDSITQFETSFLLLSVREMGPDYMIEPPVLDKYLGVYKAENVVNKVEILYKYNSITLCLLLHYFRDEEKYASYVDIVKLAIVKKYEEFSSTLLKISAEMRIFTMDLMACPYLDDIFKAKILSIYAPLNESIHQDIIKVSKELGWWFVKWKNFNMNKELAAKIAQSVYS